MRTEHHPRWIESIENGRKVLRPAAPAPQRPVPRSLGNRSPGNRGQLAWIRRGPRLWSLLHRWSKLTDPAAAITWLAKFKSQLREEGCGCQSSWDGMCRQFPPPIHSPADLFRWTVDRHNQVNARLGKPAVSLETAMRLHGRPDCRPDLDPTSSEMTSTAAIDGNDDGIRLGVKSGGVKRAIVIGNWFGDRIRPNSRASFVAAARRWGVEYVELTHSLSGSRNGFAEKLHLDLHAAEFDQVCYLDRDTVIRSDCPSPFDRVALKCFGAVVSFQPGHDWRHAADAHLRPVFDRAGVGGFNAATDHFNGGLYLFSPPLHAWIFADARELAARERDRHWAVYEEGLVSLAALRSGAEIVRLDRMFNRCGGPSREDWQPNMGAWIQHYCGDHQRRDQRMDDTIWDLQH